MLQSRKLILLEDDNAPAISRLRGLLKSPLGLAKILTCMAFHKGPPQGLYLAQQKLDSIKRVAAGLASAESHASTYKVAGYAVYAFSLQQFFASSYRARQGNVLEEVLRTTLSDGGVQVFAKKDHKAALRSELDITLGSGHDVDVLAKNKRNDFLLIQLRSRDDTGGTTAKASLVELLRDVLRSGRKPRHPIRYMIIVWEELDGNQKTSLIDKVLQSLTGLFQSSDAEETLEKGLPLRVSDSIILQLAYGTPQTTSDLAEFASNKIMMNLLSDVLSLMRSWDDLWLAYALTSLELERLAVLGKSNFELLDEKLEKASITIGQREFRNYLDSSEKIARRLQEEWIEDTLPVKSPADSVTYIRDLVLLKMIRTKLGDECQVLLRKLS